MIQRAITSLLLATSLVTIAAFSPALAADTTFQSDLAVSARMSRKIAQDLAVRQAAYSLAAQSTTDTDGYSLTPAPAVATTLVGGGGVPAASGAPRTDGYGVALGYCAWDNGSSTGAAGYIPGRLGLDAVTLAVVSPGADNVFSTTCAQIASGQAASGDDYYVAFTAGQLLAGVQGSTYFADPVATVADLSSISSTALKDGQVRLVKANNSLYRWSSSTGWSAVSAPWQPGAVSGDINYMAGRVAIGTTTPQRMLTVQSAGVPVGLASTGTRNGVDMLDAATAVTNAFFGYDNSANQVRIEANKAGSILVLSTNGGSVNVDASGVLNAGQGITTTNLTATGIINTAAIQSSGALSLTATSIGLNGPVTVAAGNLLTANGGLSSTTGAFSGAVTVNGLLSANGGISATTGVYSGLLTANGGITSTNGTFTGGVTAATGTFSGSVTAAKLQALSASGVAASLQLKQTGYGDWNIEVQRNSNDLRFVDNTSGLERVHLTQGGSVGIGSVAPNAKLEVNATSVVPSTAGSASEAAIRVSGTSGPGALDFGITSASSGLAWIQSRNSTDYTRNNPIALNPNGGSVYIGATAQINPTYTNALNVNGSIVAGTAKSTLGSVILQGNYGADATAIVGTEYGTGGPVIAYGLTPSTAASGAFTSSTAGAQTRSAVTVGDSLRFYTSPLTSVAVGSAVPMTERMRIDSSGNVGIGMTAAAGNRLDVNGVVRSTQFTVQDGSPGQYTVGQAYFNSGAFRLEAFGNNVPLALASSGSVGLTLGTNHNVGIGAAPDNSRLLVSTASGNTAIEVGGNTNLSTVADVSIQRTGVGADSANPAQGANIVMGNTSSGNQFMLQSYNGGMQFFGSYNGAAWSERMRIDNNGNLGVGTTSPAYRVDVGSTNAIALRLNQTGASGDTGIWLTRQGAGAGAMGVGPSYIPTAGPNDLALVGATNLILGSNGATEQVRITGAGLMGVGTQAPGAKLHVKSSAEVFRLESSVARGSGQNYMSFVDPTGRKGYIGYGSTTNDDLVFDNDMASNIRFFTNATEYQRVDPNGTTFFGNNPVYLGTQAQGRVIVQESGTNAGVEVRSWQAPSSTGMRGITTTLIEGSGANNQYDGNVAIKFHHNDNWNLSADMSFWTKDTTNVQQERMRIASTGNVGIGISAPQSALDVAVPVTEGNNKGTRVSNLLTGYYDDASAGTYNILILAPDLGSVASSVLTEVNGTIHFPRGSGGSYSRMEDVRVWAKRAYNLTDASFTSNGIAGLAPPKLVRFTYNGTAYIGLTFGLTASGPIYFDGDYYASGDANVLQLVRNTAVSGITDWKTYESYGSAHGLNIDGNGVVLFGTSVAPSVWNTSGRGTVEVNGTSQAIYGLKVNGAAAGYVYHDGTNMWVNNSLSSGALHLSTTSGSIMLTVNGADRLVADSSGNIGIGRTAAGYMLDVNGLIRTTGAVTTTSDGRLKHNIVTLNNDDMVKRFMQVRAVHYNLNWNNEANYGYIAQELKPLFPEMVVQDTEGYYGVQYTQMIPVLTAVAQLQQHAIEDLKTGKLDNTVNTWIKSGGDAKERFFFEANGKTIIRGHGATALEVHNAGDITIAEFLGNGDLGISGQINFNGPTRGGFAFNPTGTLVSSMTPGEIIVNSSRAMRAAVRLQHGEDATQLASARVYGLLFGDDTGVGLADGNGKALLTANTDANGNSTVSVGATLVVGDGKTGSAIQMAGGTGLSASGDGSMELDATNGVRVYNPKTKETVINLGSDGNVQARRFTPTEVVKQYDNCDSAQLGSIARDDNGQPLVCSK